MSKKTTIIVLIVGLFVAAITFLVLTNNDATAPTTSENISESTASTPAPEATNDSPTTAAAGRYIDYSDTVIADTTGTKVLFFHAPWCPQCRAIDAEMTPDAIPANTTFIKVDYDSNQALRQKYGVTIQTTFVKVDDNGDLIEKYVAYEDPNFSTVKANIL